MVRRKPRLCCFDEVAQQRWLALLHIPGAFKESVQHLVEQCKPHLKDSLASVLLKSLASKFSLRFIFEDTAPDEEPNQNPTQTEYLQESLVTSPNQGSDEDADSLQDMAEVQPTVRVGDQENAAPKLSEEEEVMVAGVLRALDQADPGTISSQFSGESDAIQKLSRVPPSKLQYILEERLEMQKWGESVLSSFFDVFECSSVAMRSAVAVLEVAFLHRVRSLQSPASRVLYTMLAKLAATQPRAVTNALVLPLLEDPDMGLAQSELIDRLIKQTEASDEAQAAVLRHACSLRHSWGEPLIRVVTSMLSSGTKVDMDTGAALVAQLQRAAQAGAAARRTSRLGKLISVLASKHAAAARPHKVILDGVASGLQSSVMKRLATKAVDAL